MKETNTHIISSFSWNTQFNKKEQAFELQQRLSNYSKFNLRQEISAVFNKVCPPDQTWKIPLLQLDLGKTDYDNLENELAEKLRKELHEKLISLIFYAGKNNGSEIEIISKDSSQLEILATFLQSGLMPWNYQVSFGSVNQLIYYQLKNNRPKLIAMIRQLGGTYENIRKRIAWQINEPNIIAIIEGLEPNNHEQVIDFSVELCSLQSRKKFVQSNTKEFKKNLWFWILNFLLKERGTLFNKVHFMKSSIKQMADHHNIAYEELFDLIEEALEEVNKKTKVKADFVMTITELSKQNKKQENYDPQNQEAANYWEVLAYFFDSNSKAMLSQSKNQYNELIVGLHQEDPERFCALVKNRGLSKNKWKELVANLNSTSIEIMLYALNAQLAEKIIEKINFLGKLTANTKTKPDIKNLWEAGLNFILNDQNTGQSSDGFLSYCIKELSASTRITYGELLEQLTNVAIPLAAKTETGFDIYGDLEKIYKQELGGANSILQRNNITNLVHELVDALEKETSQASRLEGIKQRFRKNAQTQPTNILKALLDYPNKTTLKKTLPHLLDPYLETLLLNSAEPDKVKLIRVLKELVENINKSLQQPLPEEWISEKLISLSVETLILYPRFGKEKFIRHTTYKWLQMAPEPVRKSGHPFLLALFSEKSFLSLGIPHSIFTRQEYKRTKSKKTFSFEETKQFLLKRTHKREKLIKLLLENFHDRSFTDFRKKNNKETEQFLACLINNAQQLEQKLVQHFFEITLSSPNYSSETRVKTLLRELFWKCVLDFTEHGGQLIALEKAFTKLVSLRFQIKEHKTPASHQATGKHGHVFLTNGKRITTHQLLMLIKSCFEQNKECIEFENHSIELDHLISQALETQTLLLRKFLEDLPISGVSLKLLANTTSFANFCAWMARSANGALKSCIETMAALYDFSENITQGICTGKIAHEYWKQIWILFKTKKSPTDISEKIAAFTFQVLAKETNISANYILDLIRNKTLVIDKRLHSILTHYLPGISFTLERKSLEEVLEGNNKIHTRLSANTKAAIRELKLQSAKNAQAYKEIRNAPGTDSIRELSKNDTLNKWSTPKQETEKETNFPVKENRQKIIGNKTIPKKTELTDNINWRPHAPPELKKETAFILEKNRLETFTKTSVLNTDLADKETVFNDPTQNEYDKKTVSEKLQLASEKNLIDEIGFFLVSEQKIPLWFDDNRVHEATDVLNELVSAYPATFLTLVKTNTFSEPQLSWLCGSINFNTLIVSIGSLHKNQQVLLGILQKLHSTLGKLNPGKVLPKTLQALLFKKILKAWASNNWRIVSTENIWNELIWDACTRSGYCRKTLVKELEKLKDFFPPALQVGLRFITEQQTAPQTPRLQPVLSKEKEIFLKRKLVEKKQRGGITVRNAGLVLLNSYFQMLFERLELLKADKTFINKKMQEEAIHYLQYMATGMRTTEESFLPLNKVLCGWPVEDPVRESIDINEEKKKLVHGLIKAAIGYWPQIGKCSVEGFRGNWLVRDGLLIETDERWELKIEKRPYDILLQKAPFSFSIIKYRWMDKPVHVSWQY